jgi:hypothetical protein
MGPTGTGRKSPIHQWLVSRLDALRTLRAPPAPRTPRKSALRIPHGFELRARKPRWLSSFWAARLAVRAGIALEDFLRHRLAQRLGASPVPPARLPVSLSIEEGGTVVCHPVDPVPRRAPWLESFLRAEGSASLGPEVQLAQADAARVAGRVEAQRERVAEVARELEEALRGTEVADPDDDAQARQMGRPTLPFPLGLALQLFALALLLAEAWQLAVPCLEAAGIGTQDIAAELYRNPVGVALGSIFALGAAVSLFVLAHLALRRGLDRLDSRPGPGRRLWGGMASASAPALAAAMAWSIASTRPSAHRPIDHGYARVTFFLIALAIPITTAWLLRASRHLQEVRETAVALARRWDQEHYRSLAGLSRRAAALAEEEKRLAHLETDRAEAVGRLRGLQQRAATAERLAADAADVEQQELARLAQAIAASIELDRYEYVRQAAAHGVSVERRKAPTPTPPPPRPALGDVPEHLGLAG